MAEREREALAVIERVFAEELGRDAPVDPARPLGDLALDSLEVTVLVVELEDHFRVRLDHADAGGLATLGDLARLVASKAAKASKASSASQAEAGEAP
uniref:Acyl carrier protein n=1 Tax=Jahnella sp. MSr9139 TaxID=1434086 RepID=A0A3Q8I2D0_9BACT|nr:acyl carrier protein [Jahnella sp. MSr9139]